VADVGYLDLVPDVEQRMLPARLAGLLPGMAAEVVSDRVGVAGAVLLGFLGLSALTLATFAWHPLQRLEAGGRGLPGPGWKARTRPKAAAPAGAGPQAAEEARPPAIEPGKPARDSADRKPSRGKAAKTPTAKRAAVAAGEALGPVWEVDLLDPPSGKAVDAGEAELDSLQERLEATLTEF